ncbi:MAG: glycosyltransferase family 4 protein, partial [Victivallales bacterium]|nr:glycosyltransferase family 4 protein [Victivallales bacterium]
RGVLRALLQHTSKIASDGDRRGKCPLPVRCPYFPYGGLQKDTLRFAQEGRDRGHRMTIVCTSWTGERPEGVEIVLLPSHGWSNHARMEAFAKKVREYRRYRVFDAVLTMNRIPGGDFYFVADSCMGKWLSQRHSTLVLRLHPRYRSYLRHEALLCSPHAHTSLFYIAEKQRNEYQEWYGLPNGHFVWLPPGMDERCSLPRDSAERQATRHELGLDDDTVALFLVGTNLLRKGVDRVLAAVGNLPAEVKVRFFLAGNDSSREVARLVRRMGILSERFSFLGARADVPRLMHAMDLMVHPAREEGTGTVLVEAIASGLPVICTQVCGFENYVRAATATVVPEPYQQESLNLMLAKCLRRLPELHRRTCEYARTQDFTGRSRVAIERMEEFAMARKSLDLPRICPSHMSPPGIPMPDELTLWRQEQDVRWVYVSWLPPAVLTELIEEHRHLCQQG